MTQRQISPERKGVYYLGMALCIIGALTFLSIFASFAMAFGDMKKSENLGVTMALRGPLGMGMMILGTILTRIGSMGAAGSGVVLDPEQARKDVEPWSRMTGGVIKDTLDEADIRIGNSANNTNLPFDEQLRRLHKLREDGIISEDEYQTKKKQILERA